MNLFQILSLTFILGCNTESKPRVLTGGGYIVPEYFDSTEYAKTQTFLRKEFLNSAIERNEDFTISNDSNGNLLVLNFKQFPSESKLTIPQKYNSDLKKDFVTSAYKSQLTYILGKDTLIKLDIEKNMFADLLDSTMKNYGLLLYEGNYNSLLFWEDSIVIKFVVVIPATHFAKSVYLKTSQNGKFRTFD